MPFRRATGLAALLFITFITAACVADPPQVSHATPLYTAPLDRVPAGLPSGKVVYSVGRLDVWTAGLDRAGRLGVMADSATAGGYLGGHTNTDMVVGPGVHAAFTPDGLHLGYADVSGAIASADLRILASGTPKDFPTQMLEKRPILDAVQIVYTQEVVPGAPPKLWVIGKTGAVHHVAELRWSPTAPLLAYTIINAQPHHHWLSVIEPGSGQRRELYDSAKHFLDFTWSPDGAVLLVQVDDGDEWLYFRPDRSGPIGRVTPGGWRPDWCRCAPRA